MAQITFTIPDADLQRLLTAVYASGSQDTSRDPTPALYLRRVISNYLRKLVQKYEIGLAMDAARLQAEQDPGITVD